MPPRETPFGSLHGVKSLCASQSHQRRELSLTSAVIERPVHVEAPAGSPAKPLLEVKGLTTEFTTHDGALRAVNDVSLTVEPGKVLAILGESGSGKSMLLRTVLGIQPKSARTSGQVLMNDRDLLQMDAGERERIRGTWLAMIFQDPMTALDPLFTVEHQIVETIRRHTSMSTSGSRSSCPRALAAGADSLAGAPS